MATLPEIAKAFGLKKSRQNYHGACPVCLYPSAFSLSEENGRLLSKCFAAGCSFDSVVGILKELGQVPSIRSSYRKINPIPLHGKISERSQKSDRRSHIQLWEKSTQLKGSLAENYLQTRGVGENLPPTLRYLPSAFHSPSEQKLPALIARVDRVDSVLPVGVHRTFLDPSGDGKAKVLCNKMMLGSIDGGSVHLSSPTDILAVTEGLETGLSVQLKTGIPTWAGLSTSGMIGLVLPAGLKLVFICADHDEPGLRAAEEAVRRYYKQGVAVKIVKPKQPDLDFNDLLLIEAREVTRDGKG